MIEGPLVWVGKDNGTPGDRSEQRVGRRETSEIVGPRRPGSQFPVRKRSGSEGKANPTTLTCSAGPDSKGDLRVKVSLVRVWGLELEAKG